MNWCIVLCLPACILSDSSGSIGFFSIFFILKKHKLDLAQCEKPVRYSSTDIKGSAKNLSPVAPV